MQWLRQSRRCRRLCNALIRHARKTSRGCLRLPEGRIPCSFVPGDQTVRDFWKRRTELGCGKGLNEVLRRYELGKIDFGQVFESLGQAYVGSDRDIAQDELLDDDGGVANAIDAVTAGIEVVVLDRAARTIARSGHFGL